MATLRRVGAELGALLSIEMRWRGAGLDRLLDERHAVLVGLAIRRLRRHGWLTQPEVSYSHFGERGAIDVLAWRDGERALLVVEAKTELVSIEETIRRLDQKARLAGGIALERFRWRAVHMGRLLVVAEGTTARRRVLRHAAVLGAACRARGPAVTQWLRDPAGGFSGLLFLPLTPGASGKQRSATPHRVRRPRDRVAAGVAERG